MASETEFNEFISFYGDDHKPSKKTELKRKAFENLAEIEIDEKCPVKGGKISKGIIKMAPFSKNPNQIPCPWLLQVHNGFGLSKLLWTTYICQFV